MELYEWQKEAIAKLFDKNGLLCVPTGEGKTAVAKEWADLDNAKSVIFTAPIKALSNERYLDLLNMGYDVGLITGDCVINPDAPILCMTQEIYTQRYAENENQKVIFDEIGYIGKDLDRQQAYFEGLAKTPKTSKILCMSATIGNISELQKWLENAKHDNFEIYQNTLRKKDIKINKDFDKETDSFKPNSLIFDFSIKNCNRIAEKIVSNRIDKLGLKNDISSLFNQDNISEIDKYRIEKIKELAKICGVYKTNDDSCNSLIDDDSELTDWGAGILLGVAVYHGKLAFNEKFFIETAMKLGLIDTIVGTDALALGVNFPCENVYIMSDTKMDEFLTNNEIIQMAGRAGRDEQYTQGNVYLPTNFSINMPSFISEFPMGDIKLLNYVMAQDIKETDLEKELESKLDIKCIDDFLNEVETATIYEFDYYFTFLDTYNFDPYEFEDSEIYETLRSITNKYKHDYDKYEKIVKLYMKESEVLYEFVEKLNEQHYGMPELKNNDNDYTCVEYFNNQIKFLKKMRENNFTDFKDLVDYYINRQYKLYGSFYSSSGNKYNLRDSISVENAFDRGSYGKIEGLETPLIGNENYKWALEHKNELTEYFEKTLKPMINFCKAKMSEIETEAVQEYKKIFMEYFAKETPNLSAINLNYPWMSLIEHLMNKEGKDIEKYEDAEKILKNVYDFTKKYEEEKKCMSNKKEHFLKALENAIKSGKDYIKIGNNKINFKIIPCSDLIELNNMIIDIKSGKMIEFNEQNKDEIINKIIDDKATQKMSI